MDLDFFIMIIKILSLLIAIVFVFITLRKVNKLKKETEKDLDDINKIVTKNNKKLGVTIDKDDLKNKE